jgi:dTDP-4-amino-4,6-dideoxygalactose transaminase
MKAIRKIADKHNLKVVEDNAQAIGARGDGFKIAELSNAATISFIIQKNLGTFGDGGAIVTNDPEIDRIVRKLRNHGSDKRSCHSMGYNSRLDDLHAGILSAKLKHIDHGNDLRRDWAARYSKGLERAHNITLPFETPGYRHVYHLYVIETKQPQHRDQLLQFLNDEGIDAKCHYPIAIHQQEGFPWGQKAHVAGPVPNSERNAACCVSLPMFPELTEEEVDYTIDRVLDWDRRAR